MCLTIIRRRKRLLIRIRHRRGSVRIDPHVRQNRWQHTIPRHARQAGDRLEVHAPRRLNPHQDVSITVSSGAVLARAA